MAFDANKMTCTLNGGGSDGVPYKEWLYSDAGGADAVAAIAGAGFFQSFMEDDTGVADSASGLVNTGDRIKIVGNNGQATGEFVGADTPSTSTVAGLDVTV